MAALAAAWMVLKGLSLLPGLASPAAGLAGSTQYVTPCIFSGKSLIASPGL